MNSEKKKEKDVHFTICTRVPAETSECNIRLENNVNQNNLRRRNLNFLHVTLEQKLIKFDLFLGPGNVFFSVTMKQALTNASMICIYTRPFLTTGLGI